MPAVLCVPSIHPATGGPHAGAVAPSMSSLAPASGLQGRHLATAQQYGRYHLAALALHGSGR